jgi:hypothetical protein
LRTQISAPDIERHEPRARAPPASKEHASPSDDGLHAAHASELRCPSCANAAVESTISASASALTAPNPVGRESSR